MLKKLTAAVPFLLLSVFAPAQTPVPECELKGDPIAIQTPLSVENIQRAVAEQWKTVNSSVIGSAKKQINRCERKLKELSHKANGRIGALRESNRKLNAVQRLTTIVKQIKDEAAGIKKVRENAAKQLREIPYYGVYGVFHRYEGPPKQKEMQENAKLALAPRAVEELNRVFPSTQTDLLGQGSRTGQTTRLPQRGNRGTIPRH